MAHIVQFSNLVEEQIFDPFVVVILRKELRQSQHLIAQAEIGQYGVSITYGFFTRYNFWFGILLLSYWIADENGHDLIEIYLGLTWENYINSIDINIEVGQNSGNVSAHIILNNKIFYQTHLDHA